MTIERTNKELSKMELYKLMRSPEAKPLKEAVDQIIELENFIIYTAEDKDGKEVKLVSFEDKSGIVYTTNSGVVRKELITLLDDFGEINIIKVIKGVTKAGREFLNIVLVD